MWNHLLITHNNPRASCTDAKECNVTLGVVDQGVNLVIIHDKSEYVIPVGTVNIRVQ